MGLDSRWIAAGCGGLIGGWVGSSLGITGFFGGIEGTIPIAAIGAFAGYLLASRGSSSAEPSPAPEFTSAGSKKAPVDKVDPAEALIAQKAENAKLTAENTRLKKKLATLRT